MSRAAFDACLDFVATGGYALRAYDRWQRLKQGPDGLWRLRDPRAGDFDRRLAAAGLGELRATHKRLGRMLEDAVKRTREISRAARIAVDAGVTGCTDVTGFGLLGHLGRMALESGVVATVDFASLPFLPGAVALAAVLHRSTLNPRRRVIFLIMSSPWCGPDGCLPGSLCQIYDSSVTLPRRS